MTTTTTTTTTFIFRVFLMPNANFCEGNDIRSFAPSSLPCHRSSLLVTLGDDDESCLVQIPRNDVICRATNGRGGSENYPLSASSGRYRAIDHDGTTVYW